VSNYVTVSFPDTDAGPKTVYSMSFYQNLYEHEIATIQFRDWDVDHEVLKEGSPIKFVITDKGASRTFYGYIHHIAVDRQPGKSITELTAISASMVMKNESQQIYKGLTADSIINTIAAKNGFACFAVPHPRVYPQVAQAGHTDWEMCVRLAKQSGYSLRTENTEIYFQPMLYEYASKRSEAPVFDMRDPNDPSGSTLYSFTPVIGQSISYDGDHKAAVSVSGVDSVSLQPMAITQQNRARVTRSHSVPEFFDRYATHVVATNAVVANYEAQAAEERNRFPYRATAEVIGNPNLRPDVPVYLTGIGSQYTGYWTILGTEHRIIEEQRNAYLYTTILHLGSDSLGEAIAWTDGQTIPLPHKNPTRTIIPGVRQTTVKPATTLIRTTRDIGPQSKGAFGSLNNRTKGVSNSAVWRSTTPILSSTKAPTVDVNAIPSRILAGIPRL